MPHSVLVVPAAPVDLVVPVVPVVQADQVVPAASRIVQHVLVVPAAQVVPVALVVLAVPADLVDLVDPVAVAPVAVAPVHAEQRQARLAGQEVVLHVVANPKGPSVKSLTTWKRPRWVACVCPEEMATASDFRVVQA